jgi:protein-L-isoaspartate(D-aspartate) O-methyltransferase
MRNHNKSEYLLATMNIEQARFNMVEQQIRPWDVLDSQILDLLFEVRREDFVPEAWRGLAFADLEIPLGENATMLSPKMEARMLQELVIRQTDHALEIGTGSGYVAALLGRLAKEVTTVEIKPDLAQSAKERLIQHGATNVKVLQGDAAHDWIEGAPWDVILISGAIPKEPSQLLQRLNIGGRLLAVVGDAPVMRATLWTRLERGFQSLVLFETVIPNLHNAPQPERFSF